MNKKFIKRIISKYNIKDFFYIMLFVLVISVPSYFHYFYYRNISGMINDILEVNIFKINGRMIILEDISPAPANYLCYKGSGQVPCNEIAKARLKKISANKRVKCKWRTKNDLKQHESICFIEGANIAKLLVSNGLALANLNAHIEYKEAQSEAKLNAVGIWELNQ